MGRTQRPGGEERLLTTLLGSTSENDKAGCYTLSVVRVKYGVVLYDGNDVYGLNIVRYSE